MNYIDPSGHSSAPYSAPGCWLYDDDGYCVEGTASALKQYGRPPLPPTQSDTSVNGFPSSASTIKDPSKLGSYLVGYGLLNTLINDTKAWWWADGTFKLEEAIAILLFWEGGFLDKTSKMWSNFVKAVTYKWQSNCGGGWNSTDCVAGFWGYFAYHGWLPGDLSYVEQFDLNNLPDIYGGDVYIRTAREILGADPIPRSNDVPQGWVTIFPKQTNAWKYVNNNFKYNSVKDSGGLFIVLTVNEQIHFCDKMGKGLLLCNLTSAN